MQEFTELNEKLGKVWVCCEANCDVSLLFVLGGKNEIKGII